MSDENPVRKYVYCDSHGRVHVGTVGEAVWCTAAQVTGMVMLYPTHMQQSYGWGDEQTLRFAEDECKNKGLWLFDAEKYNTR